MPELSGASRSRGPRLLKGAFLEPDGGESSPVSVPFKYNPSSLRRSVTPQMIRGESGDSSEPLPFTGPPIETIALDIEIDATDIYEDSEAMAMQSGIASQLAALELLAYPKSPDIEQGQQLLSSGSIEIAPIAAPSVLFVWGAKRKLLVRITSIQVTEEDYDENLNPIRATIGVSMHVLTYSQVSSGLDEYAQFLAYQQTLEQGQEHSRFGR